MNDSQISKKNAKVEIKLSDNLQQLIVFITYRYFNETDHRERLGRLRFLYTDDAFFYHKTDLSSITSIQAIVNIINNFVNNVTECVDPLYQIYTDGRVIEKI